MNAILLLWTVSWLGSPLLAQKGVVSAGIDIQSAGGSVASTIGQTAYQVIDGEIGIVHQGLQQPYSFNIVGIEDLQEDIVIRLFPNPAESAVFVQLTPPAPGSAQGPFTARMYSFEGKLVLEQTLPNEVNTIPIDQLNAAMYLLQVWQGNTFIKSYSLTKVN